MKLERWLWGSVSLIALALVPGCTGDPHFIQFTLFCRITLHPIEFRRNMRWPFLVGKDGSLVAYGDDCRGEMLEESVKKALGI